MKRTVTPDRLIQEISDIVSQWDAESIVDLFNNHVSRPNCRASYIDDETIEIKDGDDES